MTDGAQQICRKRTKRLVCTLESEPRSDPSIRTSYRRNSSRFGSLLGARQPRDAAFAHRFADALAGAHIARGGHDVVPALRRIERHRE